jgi:hypothetical protein
MDPNEMIAKLTGLCEDMGAAMKSMDARISAMEAKFSASKEAPVDVAMVPGTPAAAEAAAPAPAHEDEAQDKELIQQELGKLTSSYEKLAAASNQNFKLLAKELASIRAAMGKLATDKAEVDPGPASVTLNTGSKSPANSEQIRNSQDNKVVYGEERKSMSAAAIRDMVSKYPNLKTEGLVDGNGGISEAKLTESMKAAGLTIEQRLAIKAGLGTSLTN